MGLRCVRFRSVVSCGVVVCRVVVSCGGVGWWLGVGVSCGGVVWCRVVSCGFVWCRVVVSCGGVVWCGLWVGWFRCVDC